MSNNKTAKQQKPDNPQMAMTRKGIKLLIIGIVVMVAGFFLLMGGGVKDPNTFNWSMFDFRRLVAAPIVIICGLVIDVIAIMKRPAKQAEEEKK